MSDYINGYRLLAPMTNANSGYGRWGFAGKDGVQYFIKEFIDPIYPTKTSPYPESQQERIRAGCIKYQQEKQRLYQAVNEISDGNLVPIEEFFRWGSKYYITTRRISPAMRPDEVHRLPLAQKLRVCCVLCHSLMQLHEKHIVHADVKADNVLITKSPNGSFTLKLIDVDCSFFEDTPPEDGDELGGDQKYLSPEGFLFKYLGPETTTLDCKMDVYAAGLLIHQLLTGTLPTFDADCNYAFEASIDEKPIVLSPKLSADIQALLSQMLQKSPETRPAMKQVFLRLRDIAAPNVDWSEVAAAPQRASAPKKTSTFKASSAKASTSKTSSSTKNVSSTKSDFGSAPSTVSVPKVEAKSAPVRPASAVSDGRLKFGGFTPGTGETRKAPSTPPKPRSSETPTSNDGFFHAGQDLF